MRLDQFGTQINMFKMNRENKNKKTKVVAMFFVVLLVVFLSPNFINVLKAGSNDPLPLPSSGIDTSGDNAIGESVFQSNMQTAGGQTGSTENIPRAIPVDESGPGGYSANNSNTGNQAQQQAITPARGVGSCVAGQMLARLLTGAISKTVSTVSNKVTGVVESILKVPITNQGTQGARNQEADTNARTGMFVMGIQTGVSWDGIAYCVVNTIIDYIVNSTIAWANSGFKGNPAFIRNPEQFFKQLADREAANFIREVAYDTTGINVCAPFRIVISTGLAGSYSGMNNYGRNNSCSLSQMQQNAMQSGRYTITSPTDWIALTKPQNNIYYSYISAGDELSKRISVKRNTATLDLTINRGFLSYKKCKDESKPESKTNPCDTVTPGGLIADSLSKTLNMSKERLVSAQRFDQMVDAIVNNLIKIALSKALEGATGQSASTPMSSDYYTGIANGAVSDYWNGTGTDYNAEAINGDCNFDATKLIKTVTSGFTSIDTDGIERPPFSDPDYQPQTSMPGLNANTVHYVVNPRNAWSTQGGLAMGTKVAVKDNTSGVTACAIIGDNGSQYQWGEISLALARTLGVWTKGMGNQANSHNITYSFYSR